MSVWLHVSTLGQASGVARQTLWQIGLDSGARDLECMLSGIFACNDVFVTWRQHSLIQSGRFRLPNLCPNRTETNEDKWVRRHTWQYGSSPRGNHG